MAIDGTKNAAFLAARILGVSDPAVRERVKKAMADGRDGVIAKDAKLQKTGYRGYQS